MLGLNELSLGGKCGTVAVAKPDADLSASALDDLCIKYRVRFGQDPEALCVARELDEIGYEIWREYRPEWRLRKGFAFYVLPLPINHFFVCGPDGIVLSEGA